MSKLPQELIQQNPRNLKKKKQNKEAVKCEQGASLVFLPVCASPRIEFWRPWASFKMKMRVLSQALEIKCGIYTWGLGN